MQAVWSRLLRIADADVPVLITGETGTGKSLLARVLHTAGPRRDEPLHVVDCGGSEEQALAWRLLGRDDSSGHAQRGLLADTADGVLLFEEIGDLPPTLQARLLTTLERRTATPTRPTLAHASNDNAASTRGARIVATTQRDLPALVRGSAFNKGLYYALDVVTLSLPPLRERAEDIPALARSLLARIRARYPQTPVERLSEEAMGALLAYAFPGNVRELVHVLERAALCGRGPEVCRSELPRELSPRAHER